MNRDEYFNERFAKLEKQWQAGVVPALFEVIVWCQMNKLPLPDWANVPLLNLVIDLYNAPNTQEAGGGGYSSHAGRTKMDFAHYLRWTAVRNQLFRRQLKALPDQPGRPKAGVPTKRKILEDALGILELNQPRKALSRAVRELDALEESFKMVEISRKAGEARFLFEDNFTFPNP